MDNRWMKGDFSMASIPKKRIALTDKSDIKIPFFFV